MDQGSLVSKFKDKDMNHSHSRNSKRLDRSKTSLSDLTKQSWSDSMIRMDPKILRFLEMTDADIFRHSKYTSRSDINLSPNQESNYQNDKSFKFGPKRRS